MARRIEYMLSQAYNLGYDDGYKDGYEEGKMVGSLEMKEKMIDNAWNWVKGASKVMLDCDISCYEKEFRKAMEE